MSAALGVAAFVVVVLELVAAAGAVVLARRFWRQVAPQVTPLLAMFAPAPPSVPERIAEYAPPASTSSSSSDSPSPPPGSSS